jgi:hypothetical protein
MTQYGFCPRCGRSAQLVEFDRTDGLYRRLRKAYEKHPVYCESCVDTLKRQEAIDRRSRLIKQYENDRKHGRRRR